MKIKVKNVLVNYIQYGEGKDILLLHGWGQNIEMMLPISDKFNKDYNILIIDLPGFGKSSEPESAWTVFEYAECVNKIVKDLDLEVSYKKNNTIKFNNLLSSDLLIKKLSSYKVDKILIEEATLEEVFLHYYK